MSMPLDYCRECYDEYVSKKRNMKSARKLAKEMGIPPSWLCKIPPESFEDFVQKLNTTYKMLDAGSAGSGELQTCVGRALADVLVSGMKSKYSKVVPYDTLQSVLLSVCPGIFNSGVGVSASIEQWNAFPADSQGRRIIGDDPEIGYNVAIAPMTTQNFNTAVHAASKLQSTGCSAIVTVLRPDGGVMLHALEAIASSGNTIRAFDHRHGGSEVTVTEEDFNQLCILDPIATTQHGVEMEASDSFLTVMRELQEMLHVHESVVFFGNPGVGKSSLMNCYNEKLLFHSGLSLDGAGVTSQLDEKISSGKRFIDTPGLADIRRRLEAADAIFQALQVGGAFKVVFVIVLESGRIRPEDLATLELVLTAASLTEEDSFGILINKCKRKWLSAMQKNRSSFIDNLNDALKVRSIPTTQHIHFVEMLGELNDVADAVAPLDDGARVFLDSLPVTSIDRQEVRPLQHQLFEERSESFQKELEKLRS